MKLSGQTTIQISLISILFIVLSIHVKAQSAFQNSFTTNYFNSTILSKSAIRNNGRLPYDGVGKQFLLNELSNSVVKSYGNTLMPTDYLNPAYGNVSFDVFIPYEKFSIELQTSTLGEIDGKISNRNSKGIWRNRNLINVYNNSNNADRNQDGFRDLPTKQRFLGMTNHRFNKKRYDGIFSLMHMNVDDIGGQTDFDKSSDFLTTNSYGFGQKTEHTSLSTNQKIRLGDDYSKEKNTIIFHNEGRWHNQDAFYGTKELITSEQTFNSYLGYKRKNTLSNLSVGLAYRYQNISVDYSEQTENIDYLINRWSTFASYNTFLSKRFKLKTFCRIDRENEQFELYPNAKLNIFINRRNNYRTSILTLYAGKEKQLLLPTMEYQPFLNSSRTIDFPNLNNDFYEKTQYFGTSLQVQNFNFSIFRFFRNSTNIAINSTKLIWKTISIDDFLTANITDGNMIEKGSLTFSSANDQVLNHIFEANTNIFINNSKFWFELRYRYNDFSNINTPVFYPKHLFAAKLKSNDLFEFMKMSLGYFYQSSQVLNANQTTSSGNHRLDLNTTLDVNQIFDKHNIGKFWLKIGMNNLLNNYQENPIIGVENPFGSVYDGSLTWQNTTGFNVYFSLKMDF